MAKLVCKHRECNLEKDISEFYIVKENFARNGRDYHCKACRKKNNVVSNKKNRTRKKIEDNLYIYM